MVATKCYVDAHDYFEQEREAPETGRDENDDIDYYDAEILDAMTTNRGELRRRTLSSKDDKSFQASDSISV